MAQTAAPTRIGSEHIHRSQLLAGIPGVVHGITRRVAGAGVADGNVGYSAPRDRVDAWAMRREWMGAAGLDPDAIVVAYQTHGNDVARLGRDDAGKGAGPESRPAGHADGLMSGETGPVLMTLHADCMPILLCDPVRRVVATVHAGWRGTVADVGGATVRAMQCEFASDPADVLAYLGPAIGVCCYEVGDDVDCAWRDASGNAGSGIESDRDRWRFDLAAANRWLLERAGVDPARIEASGICTKCQSAEWFSHRGQGATTGRYGSFIAIVE